MGVSCKCSVVLSTVECEGYAMKNSQELNKYGQSVTTRQLCGCFVITNRRRWIWHEKKGVFLIRINVNRIKEKNLT